MLPCPSRPRRYSRHVDAAERRAGHVRDAVVPGDPLVDERVVGGQQVEHAAVLAHDAVEEQLGLAHERLAERAVEVRIERPRRAACRRRRSGAATARANRVDERFRPRIRQHALRPACRARRARSAGPASATFISSASGARAPEEERQARRELGSAIATALAARVRARLGRLERGTGTAGWRASLRAPRRRRARNRPPCAPRRRTASAAASRASLTGRRNACVASALTICAAHGRSSPAEVGRQVKILRRLGVAETPVTRCGPTMLRSLRCGSVVMPSATPICVSASV